MRPYSIADNYYSWTRIGYINRYLKDGNMVFAADYDKWRCKRGSCDTYFAPVPG